MISYPLTISILLIADVNANESSSSKESLIDAVSNVPRQFRMFTPTTPPVENRTLESMIGMEKKEELTCDDLTDDCANKYARERCTEDAVVRIICKKYCGEC